MLEQINLWLQDNPDQWLPLGIVGVLCFLMVVTPLVRLVRQHIGHWFQESPLIERIGQRFREHPETVPLGIGVLALLWAVFLIVNPVRLLMQGKNADGVVTMMSESTNRDAQGKTTVTSTATIGFKAGDRNVEIKRSTSGDPGSMCIVGCYSMGERLTILYLEDDPEIAEVQSFSGLFGGPLMLGMIGAVNIIIWKRWRSERATGRSRG